MNACNKGQAGWITLSKCEYVDRMVLFTKKAWRYADAFYKEFNDRVPIISQSWGELVDIGVRGFAVTSLEELDKVIDFLSKRRVCLSECEIWYLNPIYKVTHQDDCRRYEVVDINYNIWTALERSIFITNLDTYNILTQFATEIDMHPIVYERSLKNVLKWYNRVGFMAGSGEMSKLAEFLDADDEERREVFVHLFHLTHEDSGDMKLSQTVITLTAL